MKLIDKIENYLNEVRRENQPIRSALENRFAKKSNWVEAPNYGEFETEQDLINYLKKQNLDTIFKSDLHVKGKTYIESGQALRTAAKKNAKLGQMVDVKAKEREDKRFENEHKRAMQGLEPKPIRLTNADYDKVVELTKNNKYLKQYFGSFNLVTESFKLFLENKMFSNASLQTSDIPVTLVNSIRRFQNQIPTEKLNNTEDEVGWIENGLQQLLHITIIYGVPDSSFDRIKELYKENYPNGFKVTTSKVDYFDNKEEGYTVAILKCKSDDLIYFHYILKKEVDNKHSYDYIPHLTVAHLNYGERLDTIKMPSLFDKWTVKSIELSTSSGEIKKIN